MKKSIYLSSTLLLFLFLLSSCDKYIQIDSEKPVHIYGKIDGSKFEEIKFNVSKQGSIDFKFDNLIAKVKDDGTFSIDIDAYTMAHTWIPLGNYFSIATIYLIPGDSLEMNIKFAKKDAQPEVTFHGKYAKFYNYFVQFEKAFPKEDEFYKYFYDNYDYEASKKYWNSRKENQLAFCDSSFKNTNLPPIVVREAKNAIIYEWAFNRSYYLYYHHFWHPNHEPIKLDGNDYDYLDEILVSNPWSKDSYSYLTFLSQYKNLIGRIVDSRWDKHPGYKKSLNAFFNYCDKNLVGISKDIVLAMRLTGDLEYTSDAKKLDTMKMLVDKFKKIVKYEEYYQNVVDIYNRRLKMMPGNPAFNFTLKDIEGKPVKLSDFKGKIVYIDIWGLGCSPCMEEIPHTKKLHDDLKNEKDLIFLGINTNNGYTEIVKDFIRKRGMPGIHLFTNQQEDILLREQFMYSGIPHYLLVDRKGNFIDADMSRPSNPKTKKKLLEALRM